MSRLAFRRFFGSEGPAVLPVIHVLDATQVLRNLALARGCGAPGVFLINHDFGREAFLPILRRVRAEVPDGWIGVNFLDEDGRIGFPELARLEAEGCRFQGLWADDARLDERQAEQPVADEIAAARDASGWSGLYFGGVAFKKQRPVAEADLPRAVALARDRVEVPTFSGAATGRAADPERIALVRGWLGDRPMALASGVTPANAGLYAPLVDAVLVATGVSAPGAFHDLDAGLLAELIAVCAETGGLDD